MISEKFFAPNDPCVWISHMYIIVWQTFEWIELFATGIQIWWGGVKIDDWLTTMFVQHYNCYFRKTKEKELKLT